MKNSTRNIIYIVLVTLLMILWESGAENPTTRLLISSPSNIIVYFQENSAALFEATGVTFLESILGLLIAIAFAFGMMIICFYIPSFMNFILPIMVTSQVIPLITLAPLFILLFGIGITSKIMMAALLCFFPIFVSFATGVKVISKNIHELMNIYNASTYQKIKMVYFPLALPNIMSGLKVAATLSVIGAIVGEFNGTEYGLGKNLYLAAKRLEPEKMMCSLILASLLGGGMYYIIHMNEKFFGRWYLKE